MTVVMPVFDAEETLADALYSVLASFDDARISPRVIVVDDGSTDTSASVAARVGSEYKGLAIHARPHTGLGPTLNWAVSRCATDRFVRVDADDRVDAQFIAKLSADQFRECTITACDRREVVSNGDMIVRQVDSSNVFTLAGCGVSLATAAVRAVGGYRPVFWEEYDLYLRLALAPTFNVCRVPEPLYEYRRRPGSITSDAGDRDTGWRELRQVWGSKAMSGASAHPEWSSLEDC